MTSAGPPSGQPLDELLGRPFRGELSTWRAAPEPDAVDWEPGTLFGNYRIVKRLGTGGMGTVYQAVETTSTERRLVALKVAKGGRRSETFEKRLQNEAEALRGLDHPNIVRLLDHGEVDGTVYIATEFIEGDDLLEWSRREQPDARTVLRIGHDIAAALTAVHDRRVLHRDLSPGNVLVHPDRGPIVVDFGLGLDLDRRMPHAHLTETDQIPGKVAYLPPEAQAGNVTDARWDIYALGGCLYAMWQGRDYDPRSHHQLYPSSNLSDDTYLRKLKLVARKCLARDPKWRFADAPEVRQALDDALHPAPRWRGVVLSAVSVALILALFALAQRASQPPATGSASPIRVWSHVLHLGMLCLFGLRSLWQARRVQPTLELSRFMPYVWATFLTYYGFNAWRAATGSTGPWLEWLDATLSNLNGCALLFAFCAIWLPTHPERQRRTYRRARVWILAVFASLLITGLWGPLGDVPEDARTRIIQAVFLPSSLFVGLSLCFLAVALGQRTLQLPLAAIAMVLGYGLIQILYPAFQWIASHGEGWLIAVYGFGMIGKLTLFLSVEGMLRSWSLFGYEGQLSDQW